MSINPTAAVPEIEIAPPHEPLGQRIWENLRGGNLGSAPVILALGIMVLGVPAYYMWRSRLAKAPADALKPPSTKVRETV